MDDAQFATTRWSIVLAADGSASAEADKALATLCETYWYPLYGFVRRRGYQADEAADLTQSFFARLIEHRDWEAARPERGKFRTFLLACLKHFLANQWHREQAVKRGGAMRVESLDLMEAERRYRSEAADAETAERIFERSWACTLLQATLDTLRKQYRDSGKGRLFEQLKGCLSGDEARPYDEIGRSLGMTEGAVKSAAYRLRRDFARRLRDEIAQTVRLPEEVEQELQDLFAAFQVD